MILAINYADEPYKKVQKYNTKTAYRKGKVDKVIEYGPEDIDEQYKNSHAYAFVMNNSRVGRYGLWRPRIVQDAYNQLREGDFLIYTDSGTYYLEDIHILTNIMDRDHIDMMVFEDCNIEKKLTKRDIFVYLDVDKDAFINSNQRISSFFIIRKSIMGTEFVQQYYGLTEEAPFLFTDEENRLGKENYKEFIDTRHNQSVLSLLTKKMGIPAYCDPSEWGVYRKLTSEKNGVVDEVLNRSTFPRMFVCHRQKKIDFWMRRKLEQQYKEQIGKLQ